MKVKVEFFSEIGSQSFDEIKQAKVSKGVKIGGLSGKGYNILDDFNEPLDDLKDYVLNFSKKIHETA